MDKIRFLLAIIVSATVVFASLSPIIAHAPKSQMPAFHGSASIQECNDQGQGNSSEHASCNNSQNRCDTNKAQSKSGSQAVDDCSSRIFFQDNFSGSSIDSSKWNDSIATSGVRWCSSTIANHEDNPGTWLNPSITPCQGLMQSSPWGSVTVSGGSATLSSNFGRTFTYIWTGPPSRAAPFPASGNFTLDVNMTYKALGGSGDGFFVTRWNNTNPVGNNPPGGQQRVFLIWADSTGLFVQLLGISARLANELGTHQYTLQYGNGKYTVFVDHNAVLGPVASTTVPNTIWLGNPVFTFWGPGPWSSFSLTSVRVTGSQIKDHDVHPAWTNMTVTFDSGKEWKVFNADPASGSAKFLGHAQNVCLNSSTPSPCPVGATLYGWNNGGWGADLSSIQGATWIWAPDITGQTKPAEYNQYYFSKSFQLGVPVSGSISIAADDFAQVLVNGHNVGTTGSITDFSAASAAQHSLKTFNITPFLEIGTNVITINAENGPFGLCCPSSYSGNPAGVVFGGSLVYQRNE